MLPITEASSFSFFEYEYQLTIFLEQYCTAVLGQALCMWEALKHLVIRRVLSVIYLAEVVETRKAMATLTELPSLARMSSRVVRILGLNPGPFTLQGTNTYLVGQGRQRILIDTGDGKEGYPALLQKSLEDCEIKHIILTHWHHDHVGGLADVCKMQPNAKIWKYPCPEHDTTFNGIGSSAKTPFDIRTLKDGDTFQADDSTSLRVVFTPGHTADHVALFMAEEEAVFSGDCILGEGSAVFEDLFDYMKSLQRLIDLKPGFIYPGHGPGVQSAMSKIVEYVEHRNQREEQILACIRSAPQPWTSMDIVKVVYATTPEMYHAAAASNVTHHLKKLLKQGDVSQSGTESYTASTKSAL